MVRSSTGAHSSRNLGATSKAPPQTGVSMSGLPSRLPSLTGLRFAAAMVVFFFHASRRSPNLNLFSDQTFLADFNKITQPAGALGVSFFFVLSGFILTWSAGARHRQDTPRAFWRRRLVKIYPNYVVTWVLAMVLFAWAITPRDVGYLNLFALQPWIHGFTNYFSVDPPSWSVGIELFFYALFPLIILGARRIQPQHLKYWIGGVVAVIIATPAIVYAVLPDAPVLNVGHASDLQYYYSYVFPPARLFDFVLGILVALAVQAGRWRNVGVAWSGILLVGSYVLALYVPFLYGQRAMCVIPTAMLIAAAALADSRGRFTPFRNPVAVWLGNVSYAFYLIHFIVLVKVRGLLGHELYSTPTAIAILVADFAISVALAAVLYHAVERPMVRRWSTAKRRMPPPAAAEVSPAQA